jgi:surface carbohydrate biosynthesis protein
MAGIGKFVSMPADFPIYLLVEESFRELEARVSIAVHCAGAGRQVLIGQQWWFFENAHRLPPGIVLFKGNNHVQAKAMAAIKRHGHKVASIEEEAFGLANLDLERLFSDGIQNICDLFLAQGEAQRRYLIERRGARPEQIAITGNPRVDLLRTPFRERGHDRVENLREQYGRFVLINTNFAQINPYDHDCLNYYDRCVIAGTYKADEPGDLKKFHEMMRWERANFETMVAFIRGLRREVRELAVVVRPHPSECVERWEAAYAKDPDVQIVRDPDYISWIRAATAVVHSSCTTGLEAYFLDAKAISLTPGNPALNAAFISNLANPTHNRADGAVGLIHALHRNGGNAPWSVDRFASNLRPFVHVEEAHPAAALVANALMDVQGHVQGHDGLAKNFASPLDPSRAARSERRAAKMSVTPAAFAGLWHDISGLLEIDTIVDIEAIGPSVHLVTPREA